VDFYFDDHKGFDKGTYDYLKQIFAISVMRGVVELKGSWYHFDGDQWQGKDKLWAAFSADPLLARRIELSVRHQVFGEPMPDETPKRKRRIARSS
jgi:hypothetical protein